RFVLIEETSSSGKLAPKEEARRKIATAGHFNCDVLEATLKFILINLSPIFPGRKGWPVMRKLACAGWLIVLLAAGPVRADGDKDKEKPPPKVDPKVDPKADPKAEPKLIPLGRVAGTLQSVGGTSGFLTLRIPIRRLEPNTQAIANLAQQQRQW